MKIAFYKNESIFHTLRSIKYSFLIITFSLVGSVFGMMELLGAIMEFTENKYKFIRIKIEDSEFFRKILENRTNFKQNIGNEHSEKEKRKSQILCTQVKPITIDINEESLSDVQLE